MFILQNIKEFMENPMGKGSTVINRNLIISDLNRRYDELIKTKKIQLTVYRDDSEYYFHFIMPSESERDNTYDVVLYFTFDEDASFKYDNFLNRYYLKFFSNCPSFIYTYAFAFNQYSLLIDSLANKYERDVLKYDPITRNPGEVVSYEKSIYFACKYILNNKSYMNKMVLNTMAKKFSATAINSIVRNDVKIKFEIAKERARLKKLKAVEKEKHGVDNKLKEKKNVAVSGPIGSSNLKSKINSVVSRSSNKVNYITPKKKIKATKSTLKKK